MLGLLIMFSSRLQFLSILKCFEKIYGKKYEFLINKKLKAKIANNFIKSGLSLDKQELADVFKPLIKVVNREIGPKLKLEQLIQRLLHQLLLATTDLKVEKTRSKKLP